MNMPAEDAWVAQGKGKLLRKEGPPHGYTAEIVNAKKLRIFDRAKVALELPLELRRELPRRLSRVKSARNEKI